MTADLDAVRAMLEGVTPGPWWANGEPWNQTIWSSAENRVCFMAHSNGADDARDLATARFIAAARDLVPALAADLAATRAALTEAQGEVERLKSSLTGIRWAADYRRKERKSTGEDHEYYYHTADAALKGTTP